MLVSRSGRYWMRLSRLRTIAARWVDVGDGEVAQAAFDVRPDAFGGVEVGGVGGQLDEVQPVPAGDQVAHRGADVRVQVVPDQHDGGLEVLVGGVEQGGVVGFGEAAP